jgi:small-conductance mechanosensitive channel
MLIAADKSFFAANEQWISAAVIFAIALILAKLVDLVLRRSAERISSGDGQPLSRSALTRLRLTRRLIVLGIVLVGLFVALAQIDALRSLATALLASSAVIGIALGLASRAVLANALAGMMLASVQPFRIGDVIDWQDKRGRVEDITLSYTFVRLPSGHRLVIPNELIATSAIENYTIAGTTVDAEAAVEVRPDRAVAALKLLRAELADATVQFGNCEVDRFEIRIAFSTTAGHEATQRTATREQVVAILSDAGILHVSEGEPADGA